MIMFKVGGASVYSLLSPSQMTEKLSDLLKSLHVIGTHKLSY